MKQLHVASRDEAVKDSVKTLWGLTQVLIHHIISFSLSQRSSIESVFISTGLGLPGVTRGSRGCDHMNSGQPLQPTPWI